MELKSKDSFLSDKIYFWLKILVCLSPAFFCLIVFLTDNVNYDNLFEAEKYTSIAKYWLGFNEQEVIPPIRLPMYPLFIAFIFKIAGVDNLNALLFCQSILGILTFYFLISILENLRLSRSYIILSSILFNFAIIFRFSVFLPNCFFIFCFTLFVFFFTKFYLTKYLKFFFLMCLTYFVLLLTRPILQFSILTTIPFLIYFLIKLDRKKIVKFCLIFFLLFSYIAGVGTQILRYYNHDKSMAYTTQSGEHLFWIVSCLSKKYACGTKDMDVYETLKNKYSTQIQTYENPNLDRKNQIKLEIAKEHILKKMNKEELIIPIIISYAKVIFHSTLIEIFGAFKLNSDEIYSSGEKSITKKMSSIFSNAFHNPLNLIWIVSIFFVFVFRIIQFFGFTFCFRHSDLQLYLIILSSLAITIIAISVGIGNPRYRSDCEPILIILGAVGISELKKIISKKN